LWMGVLCLATWWSEIATHHVTRQNTHIHNILSTAPQLSISQKTLGTLSEDGNVMPKHVGLTYIIGVFVGFSLMFTGDFNF
jgi:hypothetical protein